MSALMYAHIYIKGIGDCYPSCCCYYLLHTVLPPISSPPALDTIPSSSQLSQIHQDSESTPQPPNNVQPNQPQCSGAGPMNLRGGIPPIPAKLVKRIQDGSFIEMSELLPELLCNASLPEEASNASRPRTYSVGSIIEWVRCFSCYIAVISRSQPERVVDLLGYQNLVITSHLDFPDFKWEEYDREFRLQAAASPTPQWSVMDSTQWNMARRSSTHLTNSYPSQCPPPPHTPISLAWNEHPSPGCPRCNCRFEHICYRCVNSPGIPNKRHKAIFCPNKDTKDQPALKRQGNH